VPDRTNVIGNLLPAANFPSLNDAVDAVHEHL